MAQIENIITTTFKARGSQAIAEMGGIGRAARGMTQNIQESSRMSERFSQQWRAIGTTIRYALAGGVIFGLRGMVDQLKDVQTQLGLMAAIGSQPGGGILGTPFSTGQVTRLGFDLQKTAVNAITPINQVNDATVNFLSTVQNADPGQIPKIMQVLAQGATLAQTPVTDLTMALTSMNNAFGRPNNLQSISQLTRQWYSLISLAPGGIAAGPQIATQLGPLAQVALLGRSPNVAPGKAQSQLMSLVLSSLRFGGSPSTNLRGLQYFIQSLAQPTSTGGRQVLTGMGITPQFIHDKGFYAGVIKFLRGITNTGDIKAIRGMSEDQISELDASNGTLPGIPPSEMLRLRTALGRVHAVRSAVTLAYQLQHRGSIASLQENLNTMDQSRDDTVQGAANMAKAWKRFADRSKLQQATVAINTMALQVAQTFEPVLNWAAGRLTGVQGAAHRHPTATRNAVLGLLGAGAGVGLYRFLGLRNLVRGGAGIGAASALATGGGHKTVMDGLGNNPANPLYVVVVSQLYGGAGGKITPGGGNNPGSIITGARGAGGVVAATGTRAVVGAAAAGLAPLAIPLGLAAMSGFHPIPAEVQRRIYDMAKSSPEAASRYAKRHGIHLSPDQIAALSTGPFHSGLYGSTGGGTGASQAHRLLRIQNAFNPHHRASGVDIGGSEFQKIGNRMYATFDINLKFPDGSSQKKRIHVPLDIWSGGRAPSSRAQPGNTRSR